MNKVLVLGLAGVVVVGSLIFVGFSSNENDAMTAKENMEKEAMMKEEEMKKAEMMKEEEGAMMEKGEDGAMMEKDEEGAMMEKKEDGAMMEKDEDAAMSAGSYETYAASKIAVASAEKDVILFFKANWCPSCKALDANIKANLSTIPSNLTILEVDYDNSTDLKRKYGVTTQHTLVQVDAQGNLIKKWSGGSTLTSVVAQVQ
jgi:thiol-disulfide isomerase/thioredoxin